MLKSILCLIAFTYSLSLFADDVYIFVVKNQQQKKESRWTLADWFATKERMRLMDQWLAANTKEGPLFEIMLGGEYSAYKNKMYGDVTSNEGQAALFISRVGLEADYRASDDKATLRRGMLHLRILGNYLQNTNLTLTYGLVKHDEDVGFVNHMLGGSLNLYLLGFLGLEGSYKYYLSAKNDSGEQMRGNEIEAGGFLEVFFLRIYGKWVQESLYFKNVPSRETERRPGFKAGLKLII